MKIEEIKIKNFRILKDLHIIFSKDITCIVGENDTGKTSLIDCIRVFSSDNPYKIEIDDFYRHKIKNDKNLKPEIEKEIYIELQLTNGIKVVKKFFLNENNITSNTKVFYAKEYINRQLNQIESGFTEAEKTNN